MQNKNIEGIGGWLLVYVILLAFGLVYAPINLLSIYNNPLVDIGMVFLLTSIITWLLGLSIFILIFTKKKWLPTYIISVIWISFAVGWSTVGLSNLANALYGLILNILWTLYFIKSQRVKNTFIK